MIASEIIFENRKDFSNYSNIPYNTIYEREKRLNILKEPYTEGKVYRIVNYKPIQKQNSKAVKKNKYKLKIMECILENQSLSFLNIALCLGVTTQTVNNVFQEWLHNDSCLLINSKINNSTRIRQALCI